MDLGLQTLHGPWRRALLEPPGGMHPAPAPPARPAEPPGALPFLLLPGPGYGGLLPGAHPGPGAPEPGLVHKRNERERHRVRCVNQGYARLRGHLPLGTAGRRLSKVQTLRAAIRYIRHLQELLRAPEGAPRPEPPREPPLQPPTPTPGPEPREAGQ